MATQIVVRVVVTSQHCSSGRVTKIVSALIVATQHSGSGFGETGSKYVSGSGITEYFTCNGGGSTVLQQ